jgi:hypothetical protein
MKTIAVAAVLVGALVALPGPAAHSAAPKTLSVVRHYGDGPVRVPGDVDRVVVAFGGRAGNLVRLVGSTRCGDTLWRDGRRVQRQESGFYRLPRRGEYRLVWRRCATEVGTLRLQLQKVWVHRLEVDGRRVGVRPRPGFVQAVSVTVPEDGRVGVSTLDAPWTAILLGHATYSRRDCWADTACEEPDTTFLEAGRPLSGWKGPYAVGSKRATYVPAAGERVIFLLRNRARVVARYSVLHPVSLNGDVVDLGGARRFQEVGLELGLAAGQWFRIEQLAGADPVYADLVLPDGSQEPGPWSPGFNYWRAPVTGTYRILVRNWPYDVDATVRVRSMRAVATLLPLDGTAVEFAITTPGEWVVAPVAGTNSTQVMQLAASASPAVTGWFADVEILDRYYCDMYGPLGCGDFTSDHVDAARPGPGPGYWGVWLNEPSAVVVGLEPDATGTVTARLTPAPAPGSSG